MEINIKLSKITIYFISFIIISAIFMRQVLNFLRFSVGQIGINIIIWLIFLVGAIAVFRYLKKIQTERWKILLFLLVLLLAILYAAEMQIIEERIHLVKYALLGWFVAGDIIVSQKILKFIPVILFCIAIAGVDEIFQIFIPWRVGDIRDVLFGGIGGGIGLILFLLCGHTHGAKQALKCKVKGSV